MPNKTPKKPAKSGVRAGKKLTGKKLTKKDLKPRNAAKVKGGRTPPPPSHYHEDA